MTLDDIDTLDIIDDAADTLRFVRPDFASEAPTDPDVTSIYDLRATQPPERAVRRHRQLRETRENVLRLREALASGWDICPELEHEERRLAVLEAST